MQAAYANNECLAFDKLSMRPMVAPSDKSLSMMVDDHQGQDRAVNCLQNINRLDKEQQMLDNNFENSFNKCQIKDDTSPDFCVQQ